MFLRRGVLQSALAAGLAGVAAIQADPHVALHAQTAPANRAAAIDALLRDASAARVRADFAAMRVASEEAVAQSRAAGDRLRLANALFSLSLAYFYESRPADCLRLSHEAYDVAHELGDRPLEVKMLNSVGVCQRETGQYEDAIDTLRRAEQLLHALNRPADEITARSNIAGIYATLGEFEIAEGWSLRATTDAAHVQDPTVKAGAWQAHGNVEAGLARYPRALAAYARALEAIKDTPGSFVDLFRMEVWFDIALTQRLAGDEGRSLESARAAVAAGARAGKPYPLAEANADTLVGAALFGQHDLAGAREWLMKARAQWALVADSSYRRLQLATETWIVRVLRAEGRVDEALRVSESALASLERIRTDARVDSTSAAAALAQSADTYVETIDLLMSLGRVGEAFDVSERHRARTFLDTLDERRNRLGDAVTPEQRARERDLGARAADLQRQRWSVSDGDPRLTTIDAALNAVDDDAAALRRDIRRADPRYGNLRYPETITADAAVAAVPGDTALVSYTLGGVRSYVWSLTSSGLRGSLLGSGDGIAAHVDRYRQLLSTRPGPAAPDARARAMRAEAQWLTRAILGPIAGSLAGKTRLVIVADGALLDLPFEALAPVGTSRAAWLAEQFRISYAPSATALRSLAATSRTPPTGGIVAFGDPVLPPGAGGLRSPALPNARIEVRQIAALFGGAARLFVGGAAREDTLKGLSLDQYRYVHFAAHASSDVVRPGRSNILLAPSPARAGAAAIAATPPDDGVLHADEVMHLSLNADLVTLSACGTGLGRVVRGEGVMGLSRSFLYAGARSVAASLWSVDDEGTAALMQSFYTSLRAGAPRDAALQTAQSQLIHGAEVRLRDPYYWAPFVLVGLSR